jgi:plastocyanin
VIGQARLRLLAYAALALALAAGTAPSAKPAPRTFQVTIARLAFGPTPQGARVGDVIEWVNADILRHTVTARNGAFDLDLPPKAHARMALRKAGEVSFYCRYHPGMTGKLVITAR